MKKPKSKLRVDKQHHGYGMYTVFVGWRAGKQEYHICRISTDRSPVRVEARRGIFKKWPNRYDSNWHDEIPGADWPFDLLGGANFESVADALCIPAADRAAALAEMADQLPAAAEFLHDAVDPKAVKALQSADGRDLDMLAFYSGHTERAARRRQAAAAYPVAAGIIAGDIRTKITVDRSEPLAPVLSAAIRNHTGVEVAKGLLKRIAKMPAVSRGCSAISMLRFAAAVPLDWIPTEEGEQWDAFCHAADGIISILRVPEILVPALVAGRGGDWVRTVRKVCADGGVAEEDIGNESFIGLLETGRHMVHQLADSVVLPVAATAVGTRQRFTVIPELRSIAAGVARLMLFGNRGIADAADIIRRWRNGHYEIDGIIEAANEQTDRALREQLGDVDNDGWPALTNEAESPDGTAIVPLVREQQLVDEGKAMSHCVGGKGYRHRARSGDLHIVSIRDRDGDRLSTAELELDPASDALKVRQHQGKKNSTPKPAARDALRWYIQSVALGKIKLKRKKLKAFREAVAVDRNGGPLDGLERLSGYDWKDTATVLAAAGGWRPYLAGKWKRPQSVEDFAAEPEIKKVMERIVPDIREALLGAPKK